MPQTLQHPLPPKTSIFDVTLTRTTEGELQGAKAGPGFLERLRDKFRQHMVSDPDGAALSPSDSLKLPGQPKSSIFDAAGSPEVAQKEAEEGLRFLDRWFHGHPAPVAQDEPGMAEAKEITAILRTEPVYPAVVTMVLPDPPREGIAMEWNPSWNERMEDRERGAQATREEGTRRFALPLLAVAATVAVALLGVKFWQDRTRVEAVVPVGIPEELKAYHTKAESGDVAAMRMLGLRYCYGIDTPQNPPEGVKWLRKAAAAGNAPAQRELAAMGIRAE